MKITKIFLCLVVCALVYFSWEINKRVAFGIDLLMDDLAAAKSEADDNFNDYWKAKTALDDYKVKAKEQLDAAIESRRKLADAVNGLIDAENEAAKAHAAPVNLHPTWHQVELFRGDAETRVNSAQSAVKVAIAAAARNT